MKAFIFSLLLYAICCSGCAQTNEPSAAAFTKEELLPDIDYYANNISKHHIDPFTKISKTDFFSEAAKIKKEAANKNKDELFTDLLRLNASICDEHTVINFADGKIYPFFCAFFEDGMYIVGTDTAYKAILCKKLMAINGVPIAEVTERIKALLPSSNE